MNPMGSIDPFFSGVSVGLTIAFFTFLYTAWKMRKLADDYEGMLDARDRYIRKLTGELDEKKLEERRANVVRQMRDPLKDWHEDTAKQRGGKRHRWS